MTYNINQVNLSKTGVDFSQLRKYKSGGLIPKFLSPSGNITYNNGVVYLGDSKWRNDIFAKFQDLIKAELEAATTPEAKAAVLKKYNDLQSSYAGLRSGITDLSKVSKNKSVSDYQNLINRDFSFVNLRGIANGNTIGRYNVLTNKKFAEGDRADSWKSDGWWGAQTLDRTTLGYDGDWDESGEDFKQWLSYLNNLGVETFKDKDGAYKLRNLSVPNTDSDLGMNGGNSNGGGNSTSTESGSGTYSEHQSISAPTNDPIYRRLRAFTDPLVNGATLGLSLANNARQYNLAVQQKTPRMQFTPYHDVMTGDYTYLTAIKNAEALRMLLAANYASSTSNADAAYAAQKEAADSVLKNAQEAALHLDQNYNLLLRENINTINANKQGFDKVANYNNQANVTDWNNILNARSALHLRNTQAIQDNIMKNHAGYGQWLLQLRLQDYADWQAQEGAKVQLDLNRAKEDYANSLDIMKFNGWDSFTKDINDNLNVNAGGAHEQFARWAAANNFGDNYTKLALQSYYKDHSDDAMFNNLKTLFADAKAKGLDTYQKMYTDIMNDWGLKQSQYKPLTFDNQMWRWTDRLNAAPTYQSHYPVQLHKSGGSIRDRFLQYMDHNRKAQNKETDTIMQASKQHQSLLERDLGALDRETLLLLRSIFK